MTMSRDKKLERKLERALADRNAEKIEEVFSELYLEYGKLIAFVISKYVSSREDIEELTNDVFVNFSKVFYKIELNNIKYYLITQAKNSAINHLKKKRADRDTDYVESFELIGKADDDNTVYNDVLDDLKEVLSSDEVDITDEEKYNCVSYYKANINNKMYVVNK